jgi:MFS family permease
MKQTLTHVRSFNRPIRLLLLNQLTINVGFYMLMPYLANYLAGDLGLAAWLVGLILGVRNLSQQGMFFLGGTLADRLGYKPMILFGLTLRTVGFGLLGFVDSVAALLVASALTGLAGAFFNPAVRAYLAEEAGEQRVEAFAVFNVFYQTGIVIGPLIGIALGAVAFRLTCSVAAALFAVLAILQLRALPARRGQAAAPLTFLGHWRQSLADRRFLLFSMAMMGSYVLNFQVYLGLPMEVRRVTGGTLGVTLLFAVSGLLTVVGQVRVAAWVKARWTPGQAMTRGLALMGAAFVPLVLSTVADSTAAASAANEPQGLVAAGTALAPVLMTTVLLTLATMVVYPFEMATIVELAGQGTVGTYYGLYNTISGFGIAAGNLLTGAALDAGRQAGLPSLPWIGLVALGIACSAAVRVVDRRGYLGPGATSPGEEPMERTGGRAAQALAR